MGVFPAVFWFDNAHFIIFALCALGFFATGWLHFDSHKEKPDTKILWRALGFFALTLWALVAATGLSQTWLNYTAFAFEALGILMIVIGFYMEPVPKTPVSPKTKNNDTPKTKNANVASTTSLTTEEKDKKSKPMAVVAYGVLAEKLAVVLWLLALIRIWIFSTRGLVKDLKGLAWAMLFFTLGRIVSISEVFQNTDNVLLFNLTREYSWAWGLENILMFIGAIILIRWVFFYIRFRPAPQLVATMTTISFVIFIVAAVAFSGFLFNASEKNSEEALTRSAAMFEFSLKELGRQTGLASYAIAQRNEVIDGAANNNVEESEAGLGDPVKEISVGGAAITNRAGEVLAASGSYLDVGDSLVKDVTVKGALEGEPVESYVLNELQDVDQLIVRGTYPIVKDAKVVGVALTDYPVDQAFIDTVKEVTDLDVAVNTGTLHMATTLEDKNGRVIAGTEITNDEVVNLSENYTKEAWSWSGSERLVDRTYLTVYRSLANVDNTNVGSVMVAQSMQSLIDQIASSLSMAYLVTIVLMLVSLVPMIIIARAIARSLKT